MYLPIFPVATKAKKITNLIFSIPAKNVSGSPIIGTHEKNKDQRPNLLNHLDAALI